MNPDKETQLLPRPAPELQKEHESHLLRFGRALAEAPESVDAREGYVGAGGFHAIRVKDEHFKDAILYTNLMVDGECHDIIVGDKFLQKGSHRTFDQWKTYVLRNKKGIAITSPKIEAAIKVGMYGLREHAAFQSVVEHYMAVCRRTENEWPIYGQFTYGEGTRASLDECLLNGKFGTRELDVPMLDENYVALAREQSEGRIGTIEQAENEFVTSLFGANPVLLVPAFQYFTKRRDFGSLREVRLWTPYANGRQQVPGRALALGNIGGDGRFDVNCNVYIVSRPAFGWRKAN